MTYIGIDPGVAGAVAALDDKGRVLSLQDTPVVKVVRGKHSRQEYAEPAMATLLEGIVSSVTGSCTRCSGRFNASRIHNGERTCPQCGHQEPVALLVALENVHAMPKQGVTSSFSFGVGFGLWRGVLAALRLPYTRVEPTVWKRALGLSHEKGRAVSKALQLYPRAELGHQYRGRTVYADGRAEALLLAHYAREHQLGKARKATL